MWREIIVQKENKWFNKHAGSERACAPVGQDEWGVVVGTCLCKRWW